MTATFSFDVESMKEAAAEVREAYASITNSGYPSASDCGSSLVAQTMELFTDCLTAALKSDQAKASELAREFEEAARDFSLTEDEQSLAIRDLLESIKIAF